MSNEQFGELAKTIKGLLKKFPHADAVEIMNLLAELAAAEDDALFLALTDELIKTTHEARRRTSN
jgi:hypothetical protein